LAKVTRATQALDRSGVPYEVATYDYAPGGNRVGLQAAEALGADPDHVIKTLMVRVDGKPACVMLSSTDEVSMKKLAAALGGKNAEMMSPNDAERVTGYRVGGVSPFGQSRVVPTAIDRAALNHTIIYVNGGQRGLQLRLKAADVVRMLTPFIADLRHVP
jgi:Cys-tRNA(Pro)/Cys-tRNA(Cys) deacylase